MSTPLSSSGRDRMAVVAMANLVCSMPTVPLASVSDDDDVCSSDAESDVELPSSGGVKIRLGQPPNLHLVDGARSSTASSCEAPIPLRQRHAHVKFALPTMAVCNTDLTLFDGHLMIGCSSDVPPSPPAVSPSAAQSFERPLSRSSRSMDECVALRSSVPAVANDEPGVRLGGRSSSVSVGSAGSFASAQQNGGVVHLSTWRHPTMFRCLDSSQDKLALSFEKFRAGTIKHEVLSGV